MIRRRVSVALVLVPLLAVVGVLAVMVTPRSPRPGDSITPEAVSAVRVGMTVAEVEALMGCPPGVYVAYTSSQLSGSDLVSRSLADQDGKVTAYESELTWAGAFAEVKIAKYGESPDTKVCKVTVGDIRQRHFDYARPLRRFWNRVSPW